MKIKNKGKIYPSPSASSSNKDYLSVLKLLPAAIFAIASVLSLEDREVLAYMITISMKSTTATTTKPTSSVDSKRSKSSKKPNSSGTNATHKPPAFDCDCFECYTSYWFKWDSSPNRELIHQVIEAFEEHLTKGESENSKKNSRTKRRDKSGRRVADKPGDVSWQPKLSLLSMPVAIEETASQEQTSSSQEQNHVRSPGNDLGLQEKVNEEDEDEDEDEEVEVAVQKEKEEEEVAVVLRNSTVVGSNNNHKGLARKVLPDVLGLFNSRLWNLWGPNV